MIGKMILAELALAASTSAAAAPLTIRQGETWIFAIERGQPAHARKVQQFAIPKAGEVKASLRSMLGTSLAISSNGKVGYTYRAELLDGTGKATTARACTLPPGGKPTFEHWKETADAIRLSNFKPAPKGGSCP